MKASTSQINNAKSCYKFEGENYKVDISNNITNLTLSSDGTNGFPKSFGLVYINKIFDKRKKKKNLINYKQMENLLVGPIELNPVFDDKEYLACGFKKILYIYKFSKNEIKEHTQPYSNLDVITSISWQNIKQGLLAYSLLNGKIIIFDVFREKKVVLKIDEIDICNVLKFSSINPSYLGVGYNGKIKIWDIRNTISPLCEQIINENVDVLEWHYNSLILLAGSKSQNSIKLYYLRERLELIQVLKPDFDDKLKNVINFCFIPIGFGIAAANENQVIINNYKNSYKELLNSQKLNDIGEKISFFKIKSSNTTQNISHNNNIFIIDTIQDSGNKIKNILTVKSFTYEENIILNNSTSLNDRLSAGFQNKNTNIYLNHIEYAKKKYGKSILFEDKIGENKTYNIKLSFDLLVIKLKVTFTNDYPATYPSVELIEKSEMYYDKSMRKVIEKKITEWKNDSLSYNENIICNLINNIYNVLEKFSNNSNNDQEEIRKSTFFPSGQRKLSIDNSKTIPYIRSNGICWGPNGSLVTFKSNKIDFKTLKASEKMIKKESDLIDWINSYSGNKSKFSRSDNKLLEEDSDTLIAEEFKSFIEWRGFNQLDDDFIIKSINRKESLPNIIKYNESQDLDVLRSGQSANQDNYRSIGCPIRENFNAKTNTPEYKALVHVYHNVSLKYKLFSLIKINPISKKPFFGHLINVELNRIKEDVNIQYFIDVLRILFYHLNKMLDTNHERELSVQFSKRIILSILQKFEKNKCIDYLILSILVICTKIFDDYIIKFLSSKKNIISYQNSPDVMALKTNKLNIGRYSEMHDYTYTAEEEKKFSLEFDRRRSISFATNNLDSKNKKNISTIKLKNAAHINLSDSFHLNHSNDINLNNNDVVVNYLASIFKEHTIIKFIDYLYFLSNILNQLKKFHERAEVIKLLYNICHKSNIKKYDSIFKEDTKKFGKNYTSPKHSKNRSLMKAQHFNKDVFKINLEDNSPMKCEYCGEMLKRGNLSIFRNDGIQIHLDHLKK